MWIKEFFLMLAAFSAGAMVAGGVFTVFTAVGLIPRFADRTGSAKHIVTYENMIILGTLLGLVLSIYYDKVLAFLQKEGIVASPLAGEVLLTVYGIFTGAYVGCLALSIAEMMDAIPIMTKRTGLGSGLKFLILSYAAGKMMGAWYGLLNGFM